MPEQQDRLHHHHHSLIQCVCVCGGENYPSSHIRGAAERCWLIPHTKAKEGKYIQPMQKHVPILMLHTFKAYFLERWLNKIKFSVCFSIRWNWTQKYSIIKRATVSLLEDCFTLQMAFMAFQFVLLGPQTLFCLCAALFYFFSLSAGDKGREMQDGSKVLSSGTETSYSLWKITFYQRLTLPLFYVSQEDFLSFISGVSIQVLTTLITGLIWALITPIRRSKIKDNYLDLLYVGMVVGARVLYYVWTGSSLRWDVFSQC